MALPSSNVSLGELIDNINAEANRSLDAGGGAGGGISGGFAGSSPAFGVSGGGYSSGPSGGALPSGGGARLLIDQAAARIQSPDEIPQSTLDAAGLTREYLQAVYDTQDPSLPFFEEEVVEDITQDTVETEQDAALNLTLEQLNANQDSYLQQFAASSAEAVKAALKGSDDIVKSLNDWILKNVLSGGGAGFRIYGKPDGRKTIVLGIPAPIGDGIIELEVTDENGNLTNAEGNIFQQSVKEATGQIVNQVKEIPEKIIDLAGDAVKVLQGQQENIGSVDLSGNILDIAGNVIGSIFSPDNPLGDYIKDFPWIAGQAVDLINQGLSLPATETSQTTDTQIGQELGVNDGEVIGEVSQELDLRDALPAAPGDSFEEEVEREPIYPDEDGFVPGQETQDESGLTLETALPPYSDDSFVEEVTQDTVVVEPPVTDDIEIITNEPVSPPPPPSGGGGGGMLGGTPKGYMADLPYQLPRFMGVAYDPGNPVEQLNRIILEGLFSQ